MAIVVDASVTLAWCFLDEATEATWSVLDEVRDGGGITPAIWPLEVSNAMLRGQGRGRLSAAAAAQFVELIEMLPIQVEPLTIHRALGPIRSLAQTHSLSAYDASYLELAMREGMSLATGDERLRQAAAAVGVSLLP